MSRTVTDDLLSLGLKEREIQVYLAVVRAGECSVGSIQQRTGLHRQLIYNAAASLQRRSLISIFSTGRERRFRAGDPNALREAALRNVRRAERVAKVIKAERQSGAEDTGVRLFTGNDEIARYYLESSLAQPHRSTVHIIATASRRFFEIFPKNSEAFQRIEEVRIERKVRWRILLATPMREEVLENSGRERVELASLSERLSAPIDIMVWNDHVGLLSYGHPSSVVDIPGRSKAHGFRAYFDVMWRRAAIQFERLQTSK